MTTPAKDIRAARDAFRRLHESGCFVLANPWDIGGVRRAEKLGYRAIASTSAGFAWSLGREDNQVSRDEALAHLADRKSTRLNSSHEFVSRMPSSA